MGVERHIPLVAGVRGDRPRAPPLTVIGVFMASTIGGHVGYLAESLRRPLPLGVLPAHMRPDPSFQDREAAKAADMRDSVPWPLSAPTI